MGLVTPQIGLIFWTSLSFLVVLFLLAKFAWKPILASIKERETSIEEALKAADKARSEMKALNEENEKILAQARSQREDILKEARQIKDSMISEAKEKAKQEAAKLMESARIELDSRKKEMLSEVKGMVAEYSVEIAGKILRQKLQEDAAQKKLVKDLLNDVTLN